MSKIAILGAGESGAGAAVLAKKQGFEVFVSDMSKINDKYKKTTTRLSGRKAIIQRRRFWMPTKSSKVPASPIPLL